MGKYKLNEIGVKNQEKSVEDIIQETNKLSDIYKQEISQSYDTIIKVSLFPVEQIIEDNILKQICSYGIDIDKEQLLSALSYDRNQYEKGYYNGITRAIDKMAKMIYENEKLAETIRTDICNKQGCHYECVQQEPNCLDCFKQWLNSEVEEKANER